LPQIADGATAVATESYTLCCQHGESLRVKYSLEEVRRRVQDSEEQISTEHIQNYLRSVYAKHAERMLLSDEILESVSI